MDEYAGFAKWGLLWVLAGVVIWSVLKSLTRASNPPVPPMEQAEPQHNQGPPTLFEGLVFPGQSITAHATETLERTFDAIGAKCPVKDRPTDYIFLTALVEEAYRQSFRDDLGLDTGNYEAFANSLFGAAEQGYERRFGPWKPQDEEDMSENFFEAVTGHSLDLDGMWFDYAQECDRWHPDGAWSRMLRRQHMSDCGDALDEEAAGLIAARIATLRQ